MRYIEVELFFGFPLDEQFLSALDSVDKRLYDLYVQKGDAYLQRFDHEGRSYLGKPVGMISDVSTLELLQLNIYSLLKKLLPDFPFDTTPLQLVPIVHTLETSK